MELRHLRYYVAVAEAENVTRAAAKLHVSQPGLSRQIHDLEDELGFPLLERTSKAVRLTEAGRVFLTEARAVLQRAEQAVQAARVRAGGAQGELRVGYAPSLTVQMLPKALRKFQEEFPNVRVRLHDLSTEEMLAGLGDGKLQLALSARPARKLPRSLRFEELARYPLCVALPPTHPLARSRTIALARLAAEPLIAYSRADYPEYHDQLSRLFKPLKTTPRIVAEHDSVTSLMAAVEAGRGVAIVPGCLACLAGPRLKVIPLREPGPPVIVGALLRAGEKSPLVQKFIAATR